MRDFLSNNTARPSTAVPGHWLLKLPSATAQISIRRFRERPDCSADDGSILAKLRNDPIEKGWREINGSDEGEVTGLLDGPCCTIVRGDGGRELWLFFAREASDVFVVDDFRFHEDGLEEVRPSPDSIQPAHLLICSEHGHDLSCVSAGTWKACPVQFKPTQETSSRWELLTDAVVEKLAWKFGRRVVMRPGLTTLSPGSPIRATLRPLPSAQFLLVLQPQPPPRCQPLNPGSTLPRHLRPLILQPLGLPVLLLGSHSTTPPQHAHLSSTFETVLGSAWKQGRAERRLSTQLANEHFSDWSVYWVPVPLVSEQPDISKTAPIQLAAEWQRRQGINTIWPTHLVDDLSSEYSTLSRKRLKPSPLIKLPRTDELMGVAADVFDFLSNFHEPPPITVTPREDDTTAVEMENVDEPEESSLFGGDEEPKPDPEPGSDIDDLFSTRSGSPGPPEPLPLDPDEIAGQTFNGLLEEPDVEHVVEFWDDVFMASSPRPVAAVDRPGASEVADDTILVTEDDFNFFDSPAEATEDVQPAESDEHDIPAEAAPVEVVDENVAEIAVAPIVAEPDEHAGHDDANRHEAAESPISPVSPLQPVTEPTEERPQPSPPHPKRPPLPHLERLDFIPSPFEALPLGVAPQPPSFTYDLPSPAPTPESLRPELIDRLRHSKRAKLDYAAAWEVESEASEVGDEDDYSGAPPTPVSEVDTGDTQSPKDTPRSHRGSLSQDEVEFKGIICVGIEWFSLKDDQAAMNPLCRAWNAGWIEGRLSPVSDGNLASLPRHPSFRVELLSTLDCDRFGSETIANRHFRNLFTPASDMEVASDTVALPPLLTGGDDLESISRSDAEQSSTIRSLSPCQIHAGYSNNVMRLSVAGLRYWRELGLQPVGGKKDITAFVVGEMGDGSQRAASGFLQSMGELYQQCRLGSHRPGEAPMAVNGVVAIPVAGFADSIAGLIARQIDNSVVYVLLPKYPQHNLIQRLLSLSASAIETCIVQPITSTALLHRQLQDLACEVYDRLPRLVKRVEVRGLPMDEPPAYLQYPRITLAPDDPPKPDLTLAWPLRSYDMLNRWRLVHCAYGYNEKLEMLVAYAIDAEGDGWEIRTWPGTPFIMLPGRVDELWELFTGFAAAAAIEWRVTISRLGIMGTDEYDSWQHLLGAKEAPVTLLMVDPPSPPGSTQTHPRPVAQHISPAILADPSTRIIDESLFAHSAIFANRVQVNLTNPPQRPERKCIYAASSFIVSVATNGQYSSPVYHVLSHRPAPGKEDEDVDELLARQFYRLCCLGRMKLGFEGALPVHLEGVRVALECLEGFVTDGVA